MNMFCQKCGKETPDNAQFCKTCGAPVSAGAAQPVPPTFQQPVVTAQPPKKKKAGKIVLAVIGAIVVLAIVGNMFGSKEDSGNTTAANAGANASSSAAKEEKPKEETIKISAVDILAEYEANEVAATEKYKGKMLEISGIIDDFGKDILDKTYLTISDGKEFSTNAVQFYFDDSEVSKVAELKKGDSVVIVGRCGDFNVFNLSVKNCKLK